MTHFSERLRAEIEYSGMLQKELAAKAGIKKRALDMYLGQQASMPPADVAVKLARALGVTVEYLVTGKNYAFSRTAPKNAARLAMEVRTLSEEQADAILRLVRVFK